jgi:hypothetical protein
VVYEMCVYTLLVGKLPDFQALFEKEALPAVSKYLKPIGWWSTEIGPLNKVVHLWSYEDMSHRVTATSSGSRHRPRWSLP